MYARVSTYDIRPGQIEERLRHGRDVSTPSRKQQPGARGFLNLVDRRAHKNMSISVWDTADDMLAAERHDDHFKRLSHHRYAAGDIVREHFEVAAVRRGPGGALPTGRYACVRIYQIRPGKIEDRLHHGREVTYPAVRQFGGFRGALVLVDRTTHKNVTVSLWETEAQMLAMERNEGYARMRSHPHVVGEVSTQYFEVARHD